MMVARNFAEPRPVVGKRSIGIWGLAVWAFQREAAQLDFVRAGSSADQFTGFGFTSMTAIIAEHEQLGCRVDGGGRSDSHPDADLVAAAVSVLSEGCGGERMALMMVEHARAGALPDWRVETSIRPRDWFTNRHGRTAMTADAAELGRLGWPAQSRTNRKGVEVLDAVLYCPIIIHGDAAEAARKRRQWLQFRSALLELRASFQIRSDLSSWVVTDKLPPLKPWHVC
jgi:hypothetical protein